MNLYQNQKLLRRQKYQAVKIYLDLGFEPYKLEDNYLGWQIIKKVTNHAKLFNINEIEYNDVYKIYQEADILLKTSILESFSYPPLEMMATGGLCVVRPNGGNVEYLKDNYNCLFYSKEEEAIEKINELSTDSKLRDKLIKNGLETAKSRSWDNINKDIINLYKQEGYEKYF